MKSQDTLFPLPKVRENNKAPQIREGIRRLKTPQRDQYEFKMSCLDCELSDDHKARLVWDYVCKLDLSNIIKTIKSVDNSPGSPAIDPHILFSLWLYGFTEGIVSARTIAKYSEEHIAFKWLCGGVSVNYHTISDFRTLHGEALDELLTQSVGVLSYQGLISLDRIAQDGMKVEANAGKSSFRREQTLETHLEKARGYISELKKELEDNPNSYSARQAAAKKRAAQEKILKLEKALDELKKHRAEREKALKKKRNKLSEEVKKDMRASTTDPEARNMKMSNGGFDPAYNVQFASDTGNKAILGVTVTQAGHDYDQLLPMQDQLKKRYGKRPSEVLADPGYLNYKDVEKVAQHTRVYIPADSVKVSENQLPGILEIKKRMDTDEAKEIYKIRASTAEFVNARVRSRGLKQVMVRGLEKVTAVVTLFAIGNNMLIWFGLNMMH